MSISVKKEAPGPTSVRQPSGTRASAASSGAGLRGRRAAPPPARPKATTPGCLSCCGGAIEHDEVANAAFDPLLPLPDIDFTNHFTRGLLAPVATAACPFTACGARVAASNLAAHTLSCGAAGPLHKCGVYRFLAAEGFERWRLQDLMHLTQSSHAALTKAAETWNRERAGQAPDGVVLHQISANDTLQGLAIQYGATQQAIRLANRLPMGFSYIHAHASLLIPTQEGCMDGSGLHDATPTCEEIQWLARIRAVDVLRSEAPHCDADEAAVLLAMCDFDLEAARAECADSAPSDGAPTGPVSIVAQVAPVVVA